jgi:cation-transporting ATPase E
MNEDEYVRKNILGLTDEQVRKRVEKGLVNIQPKAPSRTIGEILRANLFTKFNAINAVLAILVIIAGSPKNALFAGVIITNTIVGIVQEVRAKRTIERLSLLNVAHSKVLRNGEEREVSIEEIVVDDVLILVPGAQLLADGVVVDGNEFEVDESMLTGEAEPVCKKPGDKLLCGSFIVTGSGYSRVTNVGANTYSAKLSNEAKKFKLVNSELQNSVNKILGFIIWIIVPLGVLLIMTQIYVAKRSWQDSVISTAAGIVGMVPEGLVLLTSLTFVVGIVRISKWNALVQELPATEVLARVDTLCLDKTGTITEGNLKLVDVITLGKYEKSEIEEIIAAIAHAFPSNNTTQKCILDKYKESPKFTVKNSIPFSSQRKWSGIEFQERGAWILGAPEIILVNKYDELRQRVEMEAKEGKRVLLLAKLPQGKLKENLTEDIESVALLLIEDIIRKDAPATLEYFKQQGVNIKVISGDNPVTVAAVAKRAGVHNADKYIDATTLPETQEELAEIIENNTVFGRVTPYQKKALVNALKHKNHVVAMTGDGVNDVLALKESDCGIAIASGSDATKAVAQLVLLDSSFNALPEIVLEGRRMINNLEKVSELYLNKTVYSTIISLVFALIMLPYPFTPINITLIGAVAIGIPSFFLALGPNKDRVKKGYLRRVLSTSITYGITLSCSTIGLFIFAYYRGLSLSECRTIAVITAGGISLIVLAMVSRPLNIFKIVLIITMTGVFVFCFIIPFIRDIIELSIPSVFYIIIAIIVVILSWILISAILSLFNKYITKDEGF